MGGVGVSAGRVAAAQLAAAREIIHRVGVEVAHAAEVPERAFALEARAAGDVDPRDPRARRHRRRVGRRRRAEQRDQRHADRRRRVHQAGVVADDDRRRATAGRSRCRGRSRPARSASAGAAAPAAATTASAAARSFGEPISQTRMPSAAKRRGERGEVLRPASAWPARTRRPGQSAATGAAPARPSACTAASRFAASGTRTGAGACWRRRVTGPRPARRSGRRGAAGALRPSRPRVGEQAPARSRRRSRCGRGMRASHGTSADFHELGSTKARV